MAIKYVFNPQTGRQEAVDDAKATPVDADIVEVRDSADFFIFKKVLWSNIKATLKTYTDTLYIWAAGKSGGQTVIGNTASGGNLGIQSTAHATRGKITFGTSAYDEANNRLGIGTASPTVPLDVIGAGKFTSSVTALSFLLADGSDKNYALSVYASGAVYSLTGTPALLDFGTTDPSITIDKAGTYLLIARAQVKRNNSTHIADHTVTFKLRRTNNTAADIANSSTTYNDEAHSASNENEPNQLLPVVPYLATAGDIIQLWGSVSAAGTGGTHDVDEASLTAIRLY